MAVVARCFDSVNLVFLCELPAYLIYLLPRVDIEHLLEAIVAIVAPILFS